MMWKLVGVLVACVGVLALDEVSVENPEAYSIQELLVATNRLLERQLAALSCPTPFVMVGNECFYVQVRDMSWSDARARCQEMGADLAEPTNLTEIRQYVERRFPRKSQRNFWIGALEIDTKFQWLSGRSINISHWYTNEPSGNGDCVAMFDGWTHPLTDFPCENERRSVCQRPIFH